MAFSDTALGPFTSGAAKRLVAVSRFSKQLVAVSGSLCDKMLFAYTVSSSQALPLLHSPIVYFKTRDPKVLVAPLALVHRNLFSDQMYTHGEILFSFVDLSEQLVARSLVEELFVTVDVREVAQLARSSKEDET